MKIEEKRLQHDFPKMRGEGQRPFGTFPKIHPFWKGKASLSQGLEAGVYIFILVKKNQTKYILNIAKIANAVPCHSILGCLSTTYVSLNIVVKVDIFVNSCDVFSSNLLIIALSDLHFSPNLASTIKQNLIPLETMQTRPRQKICLHLEKLGKSTQWTEPPRNSETNLVKPGTNLRSGSLDTD